MGKAMGIPSEVLGPQEAQKKFPLLDPSVFKMALYASEDGTIDPTMACTALVKVATKNGGKVSLTYYILPCELRRRIIINVAISQILMF